MINLPPITTLNLPNVRFDFEPPVTNDLSYYKTYYQPLDSLNHSRTINYDTRFVSSPPNYQTIPRNDNFIKSPQNSIKSPLRENHYYNNNTFNTANTNNDSSSSSASGATGTTTSTYDSNGNGVSGLNLNNHEVHYNQYSTSPSHQLSPTGSCRLSQSPTNNSDDKGFSRPISPQSLTSSGENDNEESKSWKPRKKRQCLECKLYFLNLATHKSTHLKPANRPHICKYCSRGFARPNDLFRHIKCHWKEIGSDSGQFKCPYKEGDLCCHSTGIFSRCDTFKNHLKAIHFQYPLGTKKENRSKVLGKCRQCQQQFPSVDAWLTEHIETNSCKLIDNAKQENDLNEQKNQ